MNRSENTVIIATANRHKFTEIKQILADIPVHLLSLSDFPEIPKIEESGKSFDENALIKAQTVFEITGIITLADDSGLEVDALNGAPGIYSARYAGNSHNYQENNYKLLQELQDVQDNRRRARFRCVVAIVGREIRHVVEGIVHGRIIRELRGDKGFGYDPLFVPDGYEQTFAQLGEDLKNKISHRARAFQQAGLILKKFYLQNK